MCVYNVDIMKIKKPIQINLGSGIHLSAGFINVDNFFDRKDLEEGIRTKDGLYRNAIIDKGAEFVRADICDLPFKDNFADYIETIDTIEHIGFWSVNKALAEMYRVLKPGGKLSLMTTNFDELARLWTLEVANKPLEDNEVLKRYSILMAVIYGNQAGPGEYHRVPFNPYSLAYWLKEAGFDPKKFSITIYPSSSTKWPPIKTHALPEGTSILTEMLWVDAIK